MTKVSACEFTDANFPVLFSVADVELADGTVFPPGKWELCFKMSLVYLLLGLSVVAAMRYTVHTYLGSPAGFILILLSAC